jgi:hypothetical protein
MLILTEKDVKHYLPWNYDSKIEDFQ